MRESNKSGIQYISLKGYFWILLSIWTIFVALVLSWSLFNQKRGTLDVALNHARSAFQRDLVYRRWVTNHGGVYAPITEKIPPNPYLAHLEERDITTPSGLPLTLINPAYMTRQVHELGMEAYGLQGHITSLNPIRSENAADAWETEALRSFEQGVTEVNSVEELDGVAHMRLMRPLITEKGCLKCHADQGYKEGDVRGGISVSVPMPPLLAIARTQAATTTLGHGLLWLLGTCGIVLGTLRLRHRIRQHTNTEEKLQKRTYDLGKRVKELNCLYSISKLVETPGISLEEILQETVELIPPAWQYPEITCAQIILDDQTYRMSNFKETPWKQACDIIVYGDRIGALAVCYLEGKPAIDEGPFLKEERNLTNAIAGHLGKITERIRAEEEVRKNGDWLENIFKTSVDGIIVADNEGYITMVNEALTKLVGYSKDELIGKNTGTLLPKGEDYRVAIKNFLKQLFEQGAVFAYEFTYLKKDGNLMDVELNAALLKDNEGNATGSVSSIRDVTERKQAEEEIRKAKEHLDNIIEGSLDCIVVSDTKGYITKVNKSFLDKLGYNEEEVIGKQVLELSPMKEGIFESTTGELVKINKKYFDDAKEATYTQLFKEGKLFNWESYYRRKDNKLVPLEENIFYLYNKEGDPNGAVGMLRDITERKKTEREIKEARIFLENIIHTSLDGIMVTSVPKGQITMVNRALEMMLGYSEEELIGKYGADLVPDDEKSKKRGVEFITRLFEDGFVNESVNTWKRKDGSLVTVERNAALLRDDNGTPEGAVASIRNITERRKIQEALKTSEKKYRGIIENANDAIISTNRDGLIIDFNKKAEEMYGYQREEILGKSIILITPRSGISKQKEALKRAKTIKSIDQLRKNWVGKAFRKDGREFFVETSNFGVESSGERIFTTFIRDITERKNAENALRKALSEIEFLKEKLEAENFYLREEIKLEHNYREIVGNSSTIKKVLNTIELVANTDATVLIMGETGTGKELLARAIHDLSPHKEHPMVKVNCAALPPTLIEGELFGREKGAYTGALTKQIGRFELANGSTIFLDEIAELSPELQAKLLRVLQDGEFERLGSTKTVKVDVRVIAATNRDLTKAVQDGSFREDLFYRLNVFPIFVPTLRQRQEDIPLLIWSFIKEFEVKMGKRIESISQKSMDALHRYPWPGNVRELKNVIEHAMIITKGSNLQVEIPKITDSTASQNMTLQEIDRNHIISTLDMVGWRVRGENGAAEILGLKPSTLESRMVKLGIKRTRY
jgi:PAS domain S-box-containing protein